MIFLFSKDKIWINQSTKKHPMKIQRLTIWACFLDFICFGSSLQCFACMDGIFDNHRFILIYFGFHSKSFKKLWKKKKDHTYIVLRSNLEDKIPDIKNIIKQFARK